MVPQLLLGHIESGNCLCLPFAILVCQPSFMTAPLLLSTLINSHYEWYKNFQSPNVTSQLGEILDLHSQHLQAQSFSLQAQVGCTQQWIFGRFMNSRLLLSLPRPKLQRTVKSAFKRVRIFGAWLSGEQENIASLFSEKLFTLLHLWRKSYK